MKLKKFITPKGKRTTEPDAPQVKAEVDRRLVAYIDISGFGRQIQKIRRYKNNVDELKSLVSFTDTMGKTIPGSRVNLGNDSLIVVYPIQDNTTFLALCKDLAQVSVQISLLGVLARGCIAIETRTAEDKRTYGKALDEAISYTQKFEEVGAVFATDEALNKSSFNPQFPPLSDIEKEQLSQILSDSIAGLRTILPYQDFLFYNDPIGDSLQQVREKNRMIDVI